MTNGERIRQMTDEELAEWLAPRMLCSDCPLTATGDNIRKCMSLQCDKGGARIFAAGGERRCRN